MTIFRNLSKLRAFEKNHLPFLVTLEDFDIVRIIGLHQERDQPLLLKQLYLESICSYATMTRRLGKLRALGIVLAHPSQGDRRAMSLALSPQVQKTYGRYGSLLKTLVT